MNLKLLMLNSMQDACKLFGAVKALITEPQAEVWSNIKAT